MIWRRDRDSNPGWSHPHNGFRDRPVRPLRHLSAVGEDVSAALGRCKPKTQAETGGLARCRASKAGVMGIRALMPSNVGQSRGAGPMMPRAGRGDPVGHCHCPSIPGCGVGFADVRHDGQGGGGREGGAWQRHEDIAEEFARPEQTSWSGLFRQGRGSSQAAPQFIRKAPKAAPYGAAFGTSLRVGPAPMDQGSRFTPAKLPKVFWGPWLLMLTVPWALPPIAAVGSPELVRKPP